MEKTATIKIIQGKDDLLIEMTGSLEAMALAVAMAMHKSPHIENIFRAGVRAFDCTTADIKAKQAGAKTPEKDQAAS